MAVTISGTNGIIAPSLTSQGALNVSGTSTLAGTNAATLGVTGTSTLAGALSVAGASTLTNTLNVSGVSTLSSTMINNSARLSFYTYSNPTSHARYVHLKTDRLTTAESIMYTMRFDGYSYGGAIPIATTLVFYNYSAGPSVITVASYGSVGALAYKSGDGYAVLVIDAVSGYFTGFSLSQYWAAQGMGALNITATTVSTANTGVF